MNEKNYTTSRHSWLRHGAGEAVVDVKYSHEEKVRINNLNNIDALNVSVGSLGNYRTASVRISDFVGALNEIGFTVGTTIEVDGEAQVLGATPATLDKQLQDAWDGAERGTPNKGDKIITLARAGLGGVPTYGVGVAQGAISTHLVAVRILERAPEPEPASTNAPGWEEARVIYAEYEGEKVHLVKDCDGDWFIINDDNDERYVWGYSAGDELSDIEIVLEEW